MVRDPETELADLVDERNVAVIASVDGAGFPAIKAMLPPRIRRGLREFYFTTNTSSMRVAHFRANPKGCIYFCDVQQYRGLMLQGIFEVLEDAASKKMVWRQGDDQYYPLGVTDPDYCVLHFTAQSGRYYENLSSQSFPVKK